MAATRGVGEGRGEAKARPGLATEGSVGEIHVLQRECIIGPGIGQSSWYLGWRLH